MKVLITGASGQIGRFLIRELAKVNVQMANFSRRPVFSNRHDITGQDFVVGHYSFENFFQVFETFLPDVVINLASLSSVMACENDPDTSMQINAEFPLECAQTILATRKDTLLIQISSSEMYAGFHDTSINELTPLNPKSTYGKHKSISHSGLISMRKSDRLNQCNVIVFNNESYLRSEIFASKKIIRQLISIKNKQTNQFVIGNHEIKRDWNHPRDLANALRLMLFCDRPMPESLVVGSGQLHSIREFYEHAASIMDIDLSEVMVVRNPKLIRTYDNDGLRADSSRARELLNWKSEVSFHDLIRELVDYESKNFLH